MPTPQQKMDAAFDNYLGLTNELRKDLESLLDSESDSQAWRRNFIRVTAVLIEGHVHCLREICRVSFECEAPEISKKESDVLVAERDPSMQNRIKRTLRAAHNLLELQPAPNFGGKEWPSAQRVIEKRHLLMHPKSIADLDIPDEIWPSLREGAIWLIEQFFNFMAAVQSRYGS